MAVILIIAAVSGVIKAIKAQSVYLKISACFLCASLIIGIFLIPLSEHSQYKGFDTGEIYTLKLRVVMPPQINTDYCTYECNIIEAEENGTFYKEKGKIKLSYSTDKNLLSFGDIFIAPCKITKPASPLNRGDFNYGLYLKTKNIFTTGRINDTPRVISGNNFTLKDRFTLLNIKLCENIDKYFDEKDEVFLKAVLLGEKTDMPVSFYSELKRSGLSHVAAVSGMHLSYIVLLLSAFCKLLRMKKRTFSFFIIIFSLCFMLLTGLTPSVVRATIMIFCIYSGNLLIRRSDSLTSLGLAALIIVIPNPYVAFNSSFLLSFGATAGILIISPALQKMLTPEFTRSSDKWISKIIKYVISLACMSISAQLFTTPLVSSFFGEISLWAIPANLMIAPLLPFILAIGFIFCLASIIYSPLSIYAVKVLSVIISAARCIISFFGNLEIGIIHFSNAQPLFIFIYILVVMLILIFLFRKRRYAIYPCVVLFVAVIFATVQCVNPQSMAQVRFINVGQGDCALITLPENITILIDGGLSYTDENDSHSSAASTYLVQNGIRHINFMVATHANSDHTAGLVSVMNECRVDTLFIPPTFSFNTVSDALIKKAKENNVKICTLATGDSISFAHDISLTALLPDSHLSSEKTSQNNSSLVLKLNLFNTSFLFTGDIEAETERYMIKLLSGDILDSDVLKVAHHGSKTSTIEEFVRAVTPEFAVVSVGENSYGCPSSEVLKRLKNSGATVFRTDLHKDIIFVLTSYGISNIIYN